MPPRISPDGFRTGSAISPDADHVFTYHPGHLALDPETIAIDPDGFGPLPSLTRTLTRSRDNLRRPTGFVLGNEHAVGYGYDVSGRLATLSAQGLPNLPGKTHAFEYTYEVTSNLIDKVTGPVHEVDNTYEPHRDVLLQKTNTRTVGTPDELSVIGCTVNAIGQRKQRNLSGEIRADFYGGQSTDLYTTDWGYDALRQVIVLYEYDPFGRTIVESGPNAADFACRFSTKPRDPATGFYDYRYRWFDPYTERWPSRDPIEEEGGVNLYGFVGNDGANLWDLLGLSEVEWHELFTKAEHFNEKDWKSESGGTIAFLRPSIDPGEMPEIWLRSTGRDALIYWGTNGPPTEEDPNCIEIMLEFKHKKGGNSGLHIFVPRTYKELVREGWEIQFGNETEDNRLRNEAKGILEAAAKKTRVGAQEVAQAKANLVLSQTTGSVYGIDRSDNPATFDSSQWTTVRVRLNNLTGGGMRVRVDMLSGDKWPKLTDFSSDPKPASVLSIPNHDDQNVPHNETRQHGLLGLQSHGKGDITAFRNIKWRRVKDE